jgi:hypothetical protein
MSQTWSAESEFPSLDAMVTRNISEPLEEWQQLVEKKKKNKNKKQKQCLLQSYLFQHDGFVSF